MLHNGSRSSGNMPRTKQILSSFFFLRAARCYRRARERENCKHRPGRPSLHPRFSPPRVFSTGYRTSTRQPPSYGITWDTRPGASSNYRGFRLLFCSNLRPMSPVPFLTKVSNGRHPRVQLTGRFYFWMNKTRASEYFRHISIITLLLVVHYLNQFLVQLKFYDINACLISRFLYDLNNNY